MGFEIIRTKFSIWQNKRDDVLLKLLLINGFSKKKDDIKKIDFL